MKKIFLILFFICKLSYAETIQTIRFATEATYPPFEYIDESGQIKGFDIAIAQALCNELKIKCTFSNQPFASLIPSLKLGKFDALISALGITAEREKQVLFTQPYYQPSAVFVAQTAKHYSLKNISGKTIGVQQGTTFEKYLQNKYENQVSLKTYASIQDAFLDLVSGRVDAVLADTPIATTWLKQKNYQQAYSVIDHPIQDAKYFGLGYGIAVNKNSGELLKKLNQALSVIKQNGTYTAITKQYF